MSSPVSPFAYPATPLVRCHAPQGYDDYRSYKPWLRDDFGYRCVYCLMRETWFPDGQGAFGADHLRPRVSRPDLATTYSNLVYCCNRCNRVKGQTLLSLDPAVTAFAAHLRVKEDGDVMGLTGDGRQLIHVIGLDSASLTAFRARLLRLFAADFAALQSEWLAYPLDLDDLRILRPPSGNALADGVNGCAFARRERGILPDVF